MAINSLDFNQGIARIEERFGKEYTSIQSGKILLEILDDMKPTSEEWNRTVDELTDRMKQLPGIETIKQFLRREQEQKKTGTAAMLRVPCDTCRSYGFLRWKMDWKRIREAFPSDEKLADLFDRKFDEKPDVAFDKWTNQFSEWQQAYETVHHLMILCGCDNSPRWAMEESKINDAPVNKRMHLLNGLHMQRAKDAGCAFATTRTAPMWTKKQVTDRGYAFLGDFYRMDHSCVLDDVVKGKPQPMEEEYIL